MFIPFDLVSNYSASVGGGNTKSLHWAEPILTSKREREREVHQTNHYFPLPNGGKFNLYAGEQL